MKPESMRSTRHSSTARAATVCSPISLQGNTANSTLHIATDSNGDKILWTTEWNTGAFKKLLGFKINTGGCPGGAFVSLRCFAGVSRVAPGSGLVIHTHATASSGPC